MRLQREFEADPQLPFNPSVYTGTIPDPRPGNAALATNNGFDCKSLDSSFDTTNYIGAVDPSGPNWLSDGTWVSFAIN